VTSGDALFTVERCALVTGASHGIGKSIALALASAGVKVYAHGKTMADANALRASLPRALAQLVIAVEADLSQPRAGAELARKVLEKTPTGIDIVVLSAAHQARVSYEATDEEAVCLQLQVNFVASHQILRVLLPEMAARRWGRVITIGSVHEVRPNPELTAYAASKSAQANLVSNLAKQYARSGVCINNLAPGLIDTDRNLDIKRDAPRYQALLDRIPAGIAGTTEDCAHAALFLCSERAAYITGATLPVDGGLHLG
jgi:glucose 1-dehydrogenase